MPDPIRIGIIGCGRISYAHRDACERLSNDVAVVAAADLDQGRLQKFCKSTAAPVETPSNDFRRVLEDPTLDAVIICLPHFLHHPVALEALTAGKHVLVEKPMALSATEAREMAERAAQAKRTLMVGQCRRFSHAAIEMKRLVESGEVGELFRVVLNFLCYFESAPAPWRNDEDKAGKPFVTVLQGSHAFDEVLWLFGRMPVSVAATSYRRKFPLDDEADVHLDHGNGSAAIHLSLNAPPR